MPDPKKLIITPYDEYKCAVATINNLIFILNKAPLESLSEEEIKDWYNSMAIINSYIEKIKNSNNQK